MRFLPIIALLFVSGAVLSPHVGTAMSAPAAKVLVFEREGGQIWRARIDGSQQVPLTRGDFPRVSPDGRSVAFLRPSARAQGDDRELWVMPSRGGEATMLRSSPTVFAPPVWSPDSRQIAIADGMGFVVIEVATGAVRNSWPAQGNSVESLTFSPAGDRLAFTWVALGGSGVAVLQLTDGHLLPIGSGRFGLGTGGDLAWGRDDMLAFSCNEGDVCIAAADATRSVEYALAPSLRRLRAQPRGWTRDGALVLSVLPAHNGRLLRFDPATGSARYLTPWIGGFAALGIGTGGLWMLATTGHGEFGFCAAGVIERISVDTGQHRVLVKHGCDGSWNA